MGKISDILEKTGVELRSKQTDPEEQRPVVNIPIPDPPPQPPAADTIAQKSRPQQTQKPQQQMLSSAGAWDERLSNVTHSSTGVAESIRVLRTRILHPQDGRKPPQTIMVTSSAPQEGKSFVSANLAVTMARGLDQYSLLVDCDLRRPSLAGMFGLSSICRLGVVRLSQGRL